MYGKKGKKKKGKGIYKAMEGTWWVLCSRKGVRAVGSRCESVSSPSSLSTHPTNKCPMVTHTEGREEVVIGR